MFHYINQDRFWAKVNIGPTNQCWPWLGMTMSSRKRYGRFKVNNVREGAHRVSLALKLGRDLAQGKWALHTCDNPICVNPLHLYEGDRADNELDKVERGRQPGARLDQISALAIMSDDRPQGEIATHYGISQSSVSDIKTGRSWAALVKVARPCLI